MVSFKLWRYQFSVGGCPSMNQRLHYCDIRLLEVMPMVTWSELLQFVLVIIGVVGLVLKAIALLIDLHKKK